MRRLMAACMLMAGLLAPLTASAFGGRDPYKHFFHETFGDFTEELQRARDEGKDGVFIFFEMDECPFCHYMKQNVLNQRKVQEYYREHFLNFTVDIEGDIEVTDFQGRAMPQKDFAFKINRVRATPVLAFYDLEGNRIFRYTGRTSGVEEFLWMGEYVVGDAYEDAPFTRYKRDKRGSRR